MYQENLTVGAQRLLVGRSGAQSPVHNADADHKQSSEQREAWEPC